MGNIVRRVNHPESGGEEITTRNDGDHIAVLSHLRLGIYPGIRLEWSIDPSELLRHPTLLAFRSATGFSDKDDPDDLKVHGQMILETTSDGEMEEHLPEGTYYYTFLLRRPGLLGLWEKRSKPLRFQEVIPSAKVAIGRLQDQLALQNLVLDLALQHVRHEITEAEVMMKLRAAQSRLKELSQAARGKREGGYRDFRKQYDGLLDKMSHTSKYVDAIQNDVRFKGLSDTERKEFLRIIKDANDPKEHGFGADR